jgi:hypothetical protein
MSDPNYKVSVEEEQFHRRNVEKLIGNCSFTTEQLKAKSPVFIPTEPVEQFQLVLSKLYQSQDCIELVGAAGSENGKPGPYGNWLRYTAQKWIDLAGDGEHEVQLGLRYGTFMRLNPVEGSRAGRGANGCTTDGDVAVHRFCLVEHDGLPKDEQAKLLSILPLPIAAIVDSGGSSLHAWVKIGAPWGGAYQEEVKPLYAYLSLLGFDTANRNPSRLTRAPGFTRRDDPDNPQPQTLLYLNPHPETNPIFTLIA